MKTFLSALLLILATNLLTFYLATTGEVADDADSVSSIAPAVSLTPMTHREETRTEFSDSNYLGYADYMTLTDVGEVILRMEQSPQREALLELLTGVWFSEDHVALAEWLNQQPMNINADHALAMFANLASEVDPEGSVGWAASVMKPALREQVLKRTAGEFARYDPQGFFEFIQSNSQSAREVQNMGIYDSYLSPNDVSTVRHDIVEAPAEPISKILARRTRLAGSSARVNEVDLNVQ